MKIELTSTYIGESSNIQDYARNARKFLLDNVNRITFNHDEEMRILNTNDMMLRTPMSELYQQALVEKKLNIFRLLTLDKVDKIPSWFLISWLDIDTRILRDTDKSSADILNSISEFRDKILIDITPYYSEKKRGINDTSAFYSRIVRSMLCRSYHFADKMWLNPGLVYLLTKFYSIILSTKLGRLYNLTYQEQYVAATALSVYFVNRCLTETEVINPIMGKMDFLRRNVDTKPIFDFIREKYTEKTYDLKAVIETIVEFGPARMQQFNLSTFFQMNLHLTSNQSLSLVALEYPPYWCYLILSALSGDKSSLYHSIKTLNLRKDGIALENDIIKTTSFVRSL